MNQSITNELRRVTLVRSRGLLLAGRYRKNKETWTGWNTEAPGYVCAFNWVSRATSWAEKEGWNGLAEDLRKWWELDKYA